MLVFKLIDLAMSMSVMCKVHIHSKLLYNSTRLTCLKVEFKLLKQFNLILIELHWSIRFAETEEPITSFDTSRVRECSLMFGIYCFLFEPIEDSMFYDWPWATL